MEWLCSLTSYRNKAISPLFHRTLNELIEALFMPETLKRDLFFAILLIVIKENGFKQQENTEIDVVNYILQKKRDRREAYEIHIVLYPYEDTTANIIACAPNDTMLINAIIESTKETHSLCLPINEHLTTSRLGIPSAFSQLEKLVTSIKEKIVIPVKHSILSYHGQPCSNLYGLPDDALFHILLCLSLTDILNVAQSSKKLNKVLKKDNLWSQLYKRDFPNIKNRDSNWRSAYRKEYAEKNKQKAMKPSIIVSGNIIDDDDEWPDYMPVRDSRWAVIL